MSTREDLERTGLKVLNIIRNELYLDMPYLARALGNISDVMDLSTRTLGTDGVSVRYNPSFVFETYLNRPGKLNRAYMHMLLHNLLGHPWSIPNEILIGDENRREEALWRYNIACDITAEYVIDTMDVDGLRIVSSDFREECYGILSEEIRTFTAQRLYRYFSTDKVSGEMLFKMEKEFTVDDHSFWERLYDDKKKQDVAPDINEVPLTNFPLKEVWEKTAEAVRLEAERSGSYATNESGRLTWSLKLHKGGAYDYRSLLKGYMTIREVAAIDPEAFDMSYYTYGMEMYGNMPLIEELEGREEKRIDTLVIAIDTSASTREKHVRRFLEETYSLLRESEMFFKKTELLILECDDRVQREIWLSDAEAFKKYIDDFKVSGGYGTDFIPVFSRVADYRKAGKLKGLKALIYFTDGYGNYPKKATPYEAVFAFIKSEDYDDAYVPDWAKKVYII